MSALSLLKLKKTFNTVLWKEYIKKYIEGIDENIFDIQGYDKKSILSEIKSLDIKNSIAIQDRFDLLYIDLVQFFKPNIWFGNTTKVWAKNRFLS